MEREIIIKRTRSVIDTILKSPGFEWRDEMTAEDIKGWDSLSHMLIITEIEKEFGIRFKLKELNKMDNLGALITLIASKL